MDVYSEWVGKECAVGLGCISTVIDLTTIFTLSTYNPMISRRSVATINSSTLRPLIRTTKRRFDTRGLKGFIGIRNNNAKANLDRVTTNTISVNGSSVFTRRERNVSTDRLISRHITVINVAPVIAPKINIASLSVRRLHNVFANGCDG